MPWTLGSHDPTLMVELELGPLSERSISPSREVLRSVCKGVRSGLDLLLSLDAEPMGEIAGSGAAEEPYIDTEPTLLFGGSHKADSDST